MNRTTVAGVFAVCVGLAACGGDRARDEGEAAGSDTAEARPTTVTETGCLTARGDQFVLTDLQPTTGAAATSETQTYQLVGMDDELRKHIGKQIRVAGEAEGGEVAVVKEASPPGGSQPAGTSGGTAPSASSPVPRSEGQGDAVVSTETQTRMQVRTLRVASVTATGNSCAEETKTDEGAAKRPGQ